MKLIGFSAWVVGLLGFSLLVYGVAHINVPAAFILAGLLLLLWAYRADNAAARIKHMEQAKG